MSIAGPLLDRPSAIGDEGRPKATSLAVASFAVAALTVVVGARVGRWDLLLTLGTITGFAAAGLALLDRERFVHLCAGHALLTWFGWPLAVLVVAAPFFDRVGLAVAGFALALFALAATWGDAADRETLRLGVYASGSVYVGVWLWLTAFLLVGLGVVVAFGVVSLAASASDPAAAAFAFCVVVVSAGAAVLLGLRWLPIVQLTSRSRRPSVRARLETVRGAVVTAMVGATVGGGLVVVLWLAGTFDGLSHRAPALAAGLDALGSWPVVGPVAAASGVVFLAGAVAWTLRAAADRTDPDSARRLAAATAALPLAVAVVVVALVATMVPFVGPLLALFALLSPLLLVVGLAVCYAAAELRVAPDRAGGPALAAVGLLAAAVGVVPVDAWLAFACVAVAILVWDVSTYGLGITAELGRLPDTRRLELVHGVLSVGVAIGAVLLVVGLDVLRTGAFAGSGGALPALLACAGALLLVVQLRG